MKTFTCTAVLLLTAGIGTISCDRPGTCPQDTSSSKARPNDSKGCISNCNIDENCPGDQKCCPNQCNQECKDPENLTVKPTPTINKPTVADGFTTTIVFTTQTCFPVTEMTILPPPALGAGTIISPAATDIAAAARPTGTTIIRTIVETTIINRIVVQPTVCPTTFTLPTGVTKTTLF